MENPIEIIVKQGEKAYKVVIEGAAIKEIEDIQTKLGAKAIIEAIVYSIKVLSSGFSVDSGTHPVELPNGKKIDVKIESN